MQNSTEEPLSGAFQCFNIYEDIWALEATQGEMSLSIFRASIHAWQGMRLYALLTPPHRLLFVFSRTPSQISSKILRIHRRKCHIHLMLRSAVTKRNDDRKWRALIANCACNEIGQTDDDIRNLVIMRSFELIKVHEWQHAGMHTETNTHVAHI